MIASERTAPMPFRAESSSFVAELMSISGAAGLVAAGVAAGAAGFAGTAAGAAGLAAGAAVCAVADPAIPAPTRPRARMQAAAKRASERCELDLKADVIDGLPGNGK